MANALSDRFWSKPGSSARPRQVVLAGWPAGSEGDDGEGGFVILTSEGHNKQILLHLLWLQIYGDRATRNGQT